MYYTCDHNSYSWTVGAEVCLCFSDAEVNKTLQKLPNDPKLPACCPGINHFVFNREAPATYSCPRVDLNE